ncbi:Uncharacterised protein [Staphylococcus simiae]|nr:Uncharacterised protein [Staphylococcus simiae]
MKEGINTLKTTFQNAFLPSVVINLLVVELCIGKPLM